MDYGKSSPTLGSLLEEDDLEEAFNDHVSSLGGDKVMVMATWDSIIRVVNPIFYSQDLLREEAIHPHGGGILGSVMLSGWG